MNLREKIAMASQKSNAYIYIQTILCLLLALIFGTLLVRLELKLAYYEERLNEIEKEKENCCTQGKNRFRLSFPASV